MQTSKQTGINLKQVIPIAATAWGAIYFISGVRRITIKALLKTIVGGCLLYQGVKAYSNTNNDLEQDWDFDEDEPLIYTESDTLLVSQDPTIE